MSTEALSAALARYRSRNPHEVDTVALFESFLRSAAEVFERRHPPGHFTGSALVVSVDGRRVLLTHHRKLDRWLQPGGHADGDADLARVALREAEEETGLPGLRLLAGDIFDLDRHIIPARGAEPEHWHYDVRFVVLASEDERFAMSDESNDLAWRDVVEVARDTQVDPSLRRMAEKWLARGL